MLLSLLVPVFIACSEQPRVFEASVSVSTEEAAVGEPVTIIADGKFEGRGEVSSLSLYITTFSEELMLESFNVTSAPGADEIEPPTDVSVTETNAVLFQDFSGLLEFSIEAELICSQPGELAFDVGYQTVHRGNRQAEDGGYIETSTSLRCIE